MTTLIGHDNQQLAFQRAFAKRTLHHAWILAGPQGLGKAGFAKQAALFLLGSDEAVSNERRLWDADPNGTASKLVEACSHPDFRWLRRGGKGDKEEKKALSEGIDALQEHELARNIKIDQIRNLQMLFSTQASISKFRVVVIDAIDDLERSGANALLKNLEEPPENTVFLLISHTPARLLPTIRSRCQILRFERLSDDQTRDVLLKNCTDIDSSELDTLVAAADGIPGRALQYLDAELGELEQIASTIMNEGDCDNRLRNELSRKLALKSATARYRAFLTRAPSLIAEQIRQGNKIAKPAAIQVWQEANELAEMAIPKALDSQAVVFRLGSLMASLAEHKEPA